VAVSTWKDLKLRAAHGLQRLTSQAVSPERLQSQAAALA
jgi:hypothetical protein